MFKCLSLQNAFLMLINSASLMENLGYVSNFLHIFFIFILFVASMVAFCRQIDLKRIEVSCQRFANNAVI